MVLGVQPQLEERERVLAVRLNQLPGVGPLLPIRQRAGSRHRAEQQVREPDDRREAERADNGRQPGELVLERHRAFRPGEQAAELAHDVDGLRARRDPEGDPGERRTGEHDSSPDHQR